METKKTPIKTLAFITLFTFSVFLADSSSEPAALQNSESPEVAELRAGKNFIETKVYTAKEDEEILKLFEGLRVADVSDGMDMAGLTNTGLMSPEIHALWKDTVNYTHRFIGIAVTVRYVPTNKPQAPKMESAPFDNWVSQWYNNVSSEPFTQILRQGSALVIDETPGLDAGSIGSNNIMSWKAAGCVGVVTNATARDTDEIITEKVPLYFREPGRGIRPGRNEVESVNRPVVCGGVLVNPGDVIVADGDGVIVVPRGVAKEVAAYAQATINTDKQGRRNLYRQLGLPEDASVK
jgi:4-hydroxy-4-methyl-2-oxoglutarate aldolase